jgi:hypothetical protein
MSVGESYSLVILHIKKNIQKLRHHHQLLTFDLTTFFFLSPIPGVYSAVQATTRVTPPVQKGAKLHEAGALAEIPGGLRAGESHKS